MAPTLTPFAAPTGGDAALGRPSGGMVMDEQRRARRERLRWHCRRALLELDIVFERFWQRAGELDEKDEAVLERLLELEDHDLWYLISGRKETDDPLAKGLVERLRRV